MKSLWLIFSVCCILCFVSCLNKTESNSCSESELMVWTTITATKKGVGSRVYTEIAIGDSLEYFYIDVPPYGGIVSPGTRSQQLYQKYVKRYRKLTSDKDRLKLMTDWWNEDSYTNGEIDTMYCECVEEPKGNLGQKDSIYQAQGFKRFYKWRDSQRSEGDSVIIIDEDLIVK